MDETTRAQIDTILCKYTRHDLKLMLSIAGDALTARLAEAEVQLEEAEEPLKITRTMSHRHVLQAIYLRTDLAKLLGV